MSHKVHIAIVIGIACMMYLIYSLVARFQAYDTAGETQESSIIDETIYIQFEKATFGYNCNGRVMDVSVAQKLGVADPKGGYKRFTVEENNALDAVKKSCGKTKFCKIEVDEGGLGFDPAPRCDKNLQVSYRCFNFDILRQADAPYAGELVIDCNNASTK